MTLNIVEDDEAVRPVRRRQRVEAASRESFGGALIRYVHSNAPSEFGEPLKSGFAGLRVDPGDDRPALRLAAGCYNGGELRLPAPVHSYEHRARRGPAEDGVQQCLLLPPRNEPDRLHGSTAESNMTRARRGGFNSIALDDALNFLNLIEQALEGPSRKTRRYRRQSRELFGDGLHQFVEEGLGRLFHLLTATPSAPAQDLLEAIRLPDSGHDGVVIGDHLREEDLDFGHRTAQQGGVNVLLLAPASDARHLGLQTGGDLLAESIERLIVLLPERGDGQPPLVHLLDKRDRATGGGIARHGRGLQQKLGQAHAERDQGEETDHAMSLQVRDACGRNGREALAVGNVCRSPRPARRPRVLRTGCPRGVHGDGRG